MASVAPLRTILLESRPDRRQHAVCFVRSRGRADKRMPSFAAHQDIEDCNIKSYTCARALRAALIGIAVTGSPTLARADIKDYEFRLVDQAIKAGPDKIITVRLINKTTGKPVPDAVIFATRLDMAPDGMQEMATKIAPVPGGEPGTYKFKANL